MARQRVLGSQASLNRRTELLQFPRGSAQACSAVGRWDHGDPPLVDKNVYKRERTTSFFHVVDTEPGHDIHMASVEMKCNVY